MKRLWICLLALLMLAGCGSGDIAATTVYQTDDPPRAALTKCTKLGREVWMAKCGTKHLKGGRVVVLSL